MTVLFAAHHSFAQKQTPYADSLSKSLSTLFNSLPDTCKGLWGKQKTGSTRSYESKLRLPRSTENRFDIATFVNYPLIFMSYVPAGNDRDTAIEHLKLLKKEIDSVTVTYKKKVYKIAFLPSESKTGENPDYQFSLVKGPRELDGTKIYIRIADADNKKYRYQYSMGIYVRTN